MLHVIVINCLCHGHIILFPKKSKLDHQICIYFQIKPKYTHDKIETTKKELQFLNPNGAGLLDVA